MRAHIGVVTWNRLELTRLCLSSLLQQTPPGYGLTVVDNGSTDGTQEYLQALASEHPHMRLHLLRRNMGVAVASNLAWDDANGADFYVKLDNDVEVRDPQWLHRLMHMLAHNPQLGMAGYRLCAKHEGTPISLADGSTALAVACCNGACACIPRAVHEQLGFWNEGFGRYGYEDLEYSWRARKAGYTLAYAPSKMPCTTLGQSRNLWIRSRKATSAPATPPNFLEPRPISCTCCCTRKGSSLSRSGANTCPPAARMA